MREKKTTIDNLQMNFMVDDVVFPSTRFQGSKLKIVDWIWDAVRDLDFETALDVFGGTGSVGYMLKQKNRQVIYNDILKFNWYIGTALIENSNVQLFKSDVDFLLQKHTDIKYPTFIHDTFKDIYFTDEENDWIDKVVTNISLLNNFYKKALAYFALFQACIIKRPYNLFHRKNLYMRLSNVERNFGNKATWDTSFEEHFRQFVEEANQAVFDNGKQNKALNLDVFNIDENYDLVYIDTPYISQKGLGVDYLDFYHFLEGLVNYPKWGEIIDYKSLHKKLKSTKSDWTDKNKITAAFDKLFDKFKKSILVVSYRADGIPSIEELVILLRKYKANVREIKRTNYKYVLSTNHSAEVLLLGI
ncbi:MAG: DNA methyltransferase [Planctomycetes bacterium RBG_13_44_8b]|nr:MAG: DNA methyltransferase [Planctomycetes bacterium RBG_13_44_8b]